jgi:hypothetical protein
MLEKETESDGSLGGESVDFGRNSKQILVSSQPTDFIKEILVRRINGNYNMIYKAIDPFIDTPKGASISKQCTGNSSACCQGK